MKYEEVSRYSDKKFKRVVGVNRTTFKLMVNILEKEYREKHLRGRSTKLSMEDMLLVALEYWYEKRTYEQIAASYGLAASNVCRSIKWIEEVFAHNEVFQVQSSPINVQDDGLIVQRIPESNRKRFIESAQF
jgi:hypothetical protein